jgi:hypothetical protein
VLKVTDGADGAAEYKFTVTVKKGVDGGGSSSDIEATTAMPCGLIATIIVLVMATRATQMILLDRKRADLRMGRGVEMEKNDDVEVIEDG